MNKQQMNSNDKKYIYNYYNMKNNSIFNLFYFGENDYDDAVFVGSFTNFDNLLEFLINHTKCDSLHEFSFMVKLSHKNGTEYDTKTYIYNHKNNELKIDHRFCKKYDCMLPNNEVLTFHSTFKFCCQCQIYKSPDKMNPNKEYYCVFHKV
jgi:hypothetical protein